MTLTYTASTLTPADLEEKPLGQPSAEPLTRDIITRSTVPFTSSDGKLQSGVWECEPGTSRWEFLTRAEVIYVVAGRMTVTRDGEQPVDLTPGTSAVFPIGWTGTWVVTEKLRKVFGPGAPHLPTSCGPQSAPLQHGTWRVRTPQFVEDPSARRVETTFGLEPSARKPDRGGDPSGPIHDCINDASRIFGIFGVSCPTSKCCDDLPVGVKDGSCYAAKSELLLV